MKEELLPLVDEGYRRFNSGLLPGIPRERILGIRMPRLRTLAKKLWREEPKRCQGFMGDLPHDTLEENHLHALFLMEEKDPDLVFSGVEKFLPYLDNWQTTDLLSPQVFRKHRDRLKTSILRWLTRDHPYTRRFAIKMLMDHFLEEDFSPEILQLVAEAEVPSYYEMMAAAWFFATALGKREEETLPFFEEKRLDPRVHNKGIQKAVESFRVDSSTKEYLKTLRWK